MKLTLTIFGIIVLGVLSWLLAASGNTSIAPAQSNGKNSTDDHISPAAEAPVDSNSTSSDNAVTETPVPTAGQHGLSLEGQTATIDWAQLSVPAFYTPPVEGAEFPLYFIHNDPESDGFYLAVEAYTGAYGTGWDGELGDYPVSCDSEATGICLHFDPDGTGPLGDAGADFATTGTITFSELTDTTYDVTLNAIVFSNGYTIPGPTRLTNITTTP